MFVHQKTRENETIQFVDVISLYPYLFKYFKSPECHPVLHVSDAFMDEEPCLSMNGLIKCSIVDPETFYYPVVPFRCNNKLMFCLCRTRVLNSSSSAEYVLSRDGILALTGTWIMDEVRLAFEMV